MLISEIFYSIQGEGYRTGVPSIFIRFFTCNLQCQGFGQKDPTDPTTYIQPWKTIDAKSIKKLSDLPEEAYQYGCDSVYSWSAKFKHLAEQKTLDQVIEEISKLVQIHDIVTGKVDIIFTGGEPLLPKNQEHACDIIEYFEKYVEDNYDVQDELEYQLNVTFETNGTQTVSPRLKSIIDVSDPLSKSFLFSVSPKLFTVSGERPEKAINLQAINSILFNHSVRNVEVFFKFVCGSRLEQQKELLDVFDMLNHWSGVPPSSVYVMPEGPGSNRVKSNTKEVAEFCLKHRFRFSDRLHTHIWENKIGT